MLLSSVGVQELDLLGEYSLNHAVYTLQLAGNIGFDRVFYQGTTFGLLRVAPAP